MAEGTHVAQADYAKNSYQATIASMALEAQKLNMAGDMVVMDTSRHYVVFVGANQDLNTSISLDLMNRTAYNMTVVPPAGSEESSSWSLWDIRLSDIERRLASMETRLSDIETRLASMETRLTALEPVETPAEPVEPVGPAVL
jgi:hypothetical protein